MKPKKSEKVNLSKNSGLYFSLGLLLIMFITWVGIEWKTYADDDRFSHTRNVDEGLDEEAIQTMITAPPPPPPPPPPPAPEVFEVVEDEEEVEEVKIESADVDIEEDMNIDDMEVEEVVDVDVPFAVIEDVPVFPGCEKKKKKDRKKCFQEKMNKHIRKHFSYPEIAQEMGIQGRVNVIFTIAKDGNITNIRTRGPDKNLEKEAARIISKLPKMKPGRQRGQAVRVPFAIPITFRLQ